MDFVSKMSEISQRSEVNQNTLHRSKVNEDVRHRSDVNEDVRHRSDVNEDVCHRSIKICLTLEAPAHTFLHCPFCKRNKNHV